MKYDTVIIGAGLSGLAAGIRLAHYGKKVCICEKHNRIGGLNSFYSRGRYDLETGLHAITNFVTKKAAKSSPLLKLLRQLRIPYDSLALREQNHSLIKFPSATLKFTNKFSDFEASIADTFPNEIDNFRRLDDYIREYNEVALDNKYISAKEVVGSYINNTLLQNMLFCPLMYYGSAVENDIDFSQFVVMYKSIYHEGFCRPAENGIQTILNLLLDRFLESNGELLLNNGIKTIHSKENHITNIETMSGEIIETEKVLSSAGNIETIALCDDKPDSFDLLPRGNLSYIESIAILGDYLDSFNRDETIMFFNDSEEFEYQCPTEAMSLKSGVVCFPSNFQFEAGDNIPDKSLRMTVLANHNLWDKSDSAKYKELKEQATSSIFKKAEELTGVTNIEKNALLLDTMTPRTIERYTGHINGAIYGSPHKVKDGQTHLDNLFVCGTDQGFLGIVGSILSGISIANLHLLR